MAWNQSFSDLGKAGGWSGDSTFVTGGDSAMDSQLTKLQERLHFPAMISSILNNVDESDKYVVGNYKFNTVVTIGVISEIRTEDRAKLYLLTEPGSDSSATLRVCKYENDNEMTGDVKEIVEGSVVMARGKLKSFDNVTSVMAFNVREITTEEMATFKLECKLSHLVYSKDVPSMLEDGLGQQLGDTCLGGLVPTAGDGQSHGHHPDRLYQPPTGGSSTVVGSQFDGQRGKIMNLFAAEKANMGEDGISLAYIREKISPTSEKSLANDLEFLISEGHIYTTTGDDMFATVGD